MTSDILAALAWTILLGVIRSTIMVLELLTGVKYSNQCGERILSATAVGAQTHPETRELKFLIDSGATSTCVSKDMISLIELTDTNPKLKVKVASGTALDVVGIGTLNVRNIKGFRLNNDGSKTPMVTEGTWHEVMVVDGLDPRIILLSVRKMRDKDNILTYFNSDNDAKVKDCLRLPSGIYVPFSSDRFEFTVSSDTGHGRTRPQTANGITTSQKRRSALHLHAALCHAGQTRVSQSNITIDGESDPLSPRRYVRRMRIRRDSAHSSPPI